MANGINGVEIRTDLSAINGLPERIVSKEIIRIEQHQDRITNLVSAMSTIWFKSGMMMNSTARLDRKILRVPLRGGRRR
jgi:hypothetical protein